MKYLSEKDSGDFINVSAVSENKKLLKSKLIELRSNGYVKTNFGEYNLMFGDGKQVKSEINLLSKITLKGNSLLYDMEKNTVSNTTNDFSGSTIGQLNQAESLKIEQTDIIQKTSHPVPKTTKKNPLFAKLIEYWWTFIVALIVGIILLMIEKGVIDIGILK